MQGIIGYGVYLPAYRISRDVIAEAWQSRSQGGMKLCGRFDEDALTMAATAAGDCAAGIQKSVQALYFASTTAPYLERLNASIVAAICDLPAGALTADLGGSLRASTTALGMAFDRVATHGGSALVCCGETREAEPGSGDEQVFGDAGAAVAVGDSHIIADLVARSHAYDDFFETSRRDRDPVVNVFDGKFSLERGFLRSMSAAITSTLKRAAVEPKAIARLALSTPDKRSHLALAKKLGFSDAQVQDVFWDLLGQTGAVMPLLALGAALEAAKPGELILAAGFGNGADAFLFRVTEAIASYKPRVPLAAQRGGGNCYPSYTLFRKAREYRASHDDGLEMTNVFYTKEEAQNIRLHGNECGHCGQRHFPLTQVCAKCLQGDRLSEVALSRTGQVFTFAVDHLAASPFPPTTMVVVDLDGGGRIYCELVDAAPEQVQIGTPVELMMRRLREGGGLHHYYWKARLRRFS